MAGLIQETRDSLGVFYPCPTLHFFIILQVQNWNSEILAKQKPLIAKPSAKLLFVNRLKGKKYKTSSSTKVLQDASNSIDHRIPSSQRVGLK